MKKFGFTLAEVLLTLVIVGVIVSVTMPTVIGSFDEKERGAKVKKVYGALSSAVEEGVANDGDLGFDVTNNTSNQEIQDFYDSMLGDTLSVIKTCYNDTDGCWNSGGVTYKMDGGAYNNGHSYGLGDKTVGAVLNDGTYISVNMWSSPSFFGITGSGKTVGIFFDINGDKKPNTLGKDIFGAYYDKNAQKLRPAYYGRSQSDIKSDCSKSGTGISCIQKYLKN